MFLTRRVAAAVTASLPVAGALFALLFSATDSQAQSAAAACEEAAQIAVLPAPIAPWKGAPLRVIVAAEKPLDGELSLIAPDGSVAAKSRDRQGGPPYFWYRRGRLAGCRGPGTRRWRSPRAGRVRHDHARHRRARRAGAAAAAAAAGSLWPVRNSWNRATENLYSAWIEKLFDAPLDVELSWPALHERAARPVAQCPVQLSGSRRRRCGDAVPSRLRRLRLFPARLFRLQDGAAVRLLELLARRRRRAAEVLRVVQHPNPVRSNSRRRSSRPERRQRRPRLHRAGLQRHLPAICRSSATPFSPAPCARWQTTTTPISIPCR